MNVTQPKVMGILNITPDSFYSKSRTKHIDDVLQRIQDMLNEGASIIDIGAMSTRPGAEIISFEEEIDRVKEICPVVVHDFPNVIFSIDTIHSKTARYCLDFGFHIVNDVSGGNYDPEMIQTVASYASVPYMIMHMRGTPKTMSGETDYQNLILEITDFFISKINECHEAGIFDIVLDPGLGFAKNLSQNFEILQRIHEFKFLNKALLIGLSRKSLIWKTLDIQQDEALNGTTALHMTSLLQGANILRVHDVKEAVECCQLFEKLYV